MLRLFFAASLCCSVLGLLAPFSRASPPLLEIRQNPHWQKGLDRNDAGIASEAIAKAQERGALGCRRYCAMLEEVFGQIRSTAFSQLPTEQSVALELIVTRLPEEAAWALSDGHVFISEVFIHDARLSRDGLAFVLAHEAAHALARDQADTLDLARAMIPLGVNASVEDIYATMDFNLGVLIELAPLLQSMETEADRNGLLLAALAGFKPEAALAYVRRLASEADRQALMASHPHGSERLKALQALLPMARRIQAQHSRRGVLRFYSSSSSSSSMFLRGTVAGSQMMGR